MGRSHPLVANANYRPKAVCRRCPVSGSSGRGSRAPSTQSGESSRRLALTNIMMPAAGEGLFGLGLGIGVPSVTLLLKLFFLPLFRVLALIIVSATLGTVRVANSRKRRVGTRCR